MTVLPTLDMTIIIMCKTLALDNWVGGGERMGLWRIVRTERVV